MNRIILRRNKESSLGETVTILLILPLAIMRILSFLWEPTYDTISVGRQEGTGCA